MSLKPCILFHLIYFSIIFSAAVIANDPANASLTFGVFPYLPTRKLEQMYAPTAARFGELLNVQVKLRTRPDFERFREQVHQQSYDIIFIQPFDYIRAAADNGYLPLARWARAGNGDNIEGLRAIFVVRADSTVNTLNDLAGKRVATPDKDAAVSLLGRHALSSFKLDKKVEIYPINNHIACLTQVRVKKAAACVTAQPTLKLFRDHTGAKLRVLYETQHIPSSLFAVHKRIPKAQRELLKNEILSWSADNTDDKAYLHGGGWSHLHPASDSDYEPVRAIWKVLDSHK
ncbi:MAG TPA: phosphate/phosphite/phosphonate ABC transporter substrate-binding protein [Gammaproteobacteria bacterium]|nr:phosphate/phosphite/phosphonate ABC transporter substrate-binding protein [Gammaproteobacteria bacterium]